MVTRSRNLEDSDQLEITQNASYATPELQQML